VDEVYIAITEYLAQSNVPKNLVIKFETLPPALIIDLGFTKQGEFWIISRADAEKALRERLGVPEPFDWEAHWENERNRPLGRQP
jgi:hypothetical protein